MKTVIVIPARYGSSRFPGKPLATIRGRSMLSRCYALAKQVSNIDDVIIATDDERILNHAQDFGAHAVMTPESCNNGTERCYSALQTFTTPPDIVISLQGDAPLTPPWVIQSLVDVMHAKNPPPISTPAIQLSQSQYETIQANKASGQVADTTVTFNREGYALYFSKSLIPFLRQNNLTRPPVFKHIGMYAYQWKTLETYLSLEPSIFEEAESLEQLRALENGIPIKVILADYRGRTPWSVDSPSDIAQVEAIIDREGELVGVN